jgi:hypothetical protein
MNRSEIAPKIISFQINLAIRMIQNENLQIYYAPMLCSQSEDPPLHFPI